MPCRSMVIWDVRLHPLGKGTFLKLRDIPFFLGKKKRKDTQQSLQCLCFQISR